MKVLNSLLTLSILILATVQSICAQDSVIVKYPILDKAIQQKWSVSQQHQSLIEAIAVAKKEKDSLSLQQLYKRDLQLFCMSDQKDSVDYYTKQFTKLSKQLGALSEVYKGYAMQASYYHKKQDYFNSLKAFDKKLTIAKVQKDTLKQVYTLRFISSLQANLGLYHESELTAIEALKLLENQKKTDKIVESFIGLHNQLGIIYKKRGQFAEAYSYYSKSLELATTPSHTSTIQNNMANILIAEKKYDEAIALLKKIISDTTIAKHKNTKKYARLLDNLGRAMYLKGDADASSYLQKSLSIRKELQYALGMYSSFYHLASYEKQFQHIIAAKQYAEKALQIAKEHHFQEEITETYELLIALGQTQYAIPYLHIKDSTAKTLQEQSQKYIAYKYNYRKEYERAQVNPSNRCTTAERGAK